MVPKAFIFDLDGVITNTAKYHFEAWTALAKKHGFKFTEKDNDRLKGVSRTRSLEIILEINNAENKFTEAEKQDMMTEKNNNYIELVKKIKPSDTLPGVSEFIANAKSAGIKVAVASASKNVFTVLKGLSMLDSFDYIADPSKISKPKPDPEVFLNCSEALCINPDECIGFEDAQAGIESIHAAGMFAVGIGVEVVTEKPDLPLSSTAELSLEKILTAFKNGR